MMLMNSVKILILNAYINIYYRVKRQNKTQYCKINKFIAKFRILCLDTYVTTR